MTSKNFTSSFPKGTTPSFETSESRDYTEHERDYYVEDYGGEVCDKFEVLNFGGVVTIVFFSVVIIFSMVGNLLVLVILAKYENLKSMTNTFLLNLALSDIIFTIGLPFWASYELHGWTFDTTVCKAVSFIFDVGFHSGIIFLTAMTIHRCIVVVHPMSVLSTRRSFLGILTSIIIWLASFLAATPAALFKTTIENPIDDSLHCAYGEDSARRATTYQQNCMFLVAFFIITVCYGRILARLLRPTSHTKHKTVRIIFIIVIVFFLGWAPYNVALFLQSLPSNQVSTFNECDVSIKLDYLYYVSRLLAFSHCCLNPLFYVFMGIKFRNHLKRLLWRYCTGSSTLNRRHSRLIYSNGEECSMY